MKKHLCHYQNSLTCDVQTVQLYPKPSDVIGPLSAPGTTKCYWLKDDQPAISNYTPLADQDAIEPIPALNYFMKSCGKDSFLALKKFLKVSVLENINFIQMCFKRRPILFGLKREQIVTRGQLSFANCEGDLEMEVQNNVLPKLNAFH